MENVIIVGASGHARVIIDIIEKEGRYKIAGLTASDRSPGEEESGYPILGDDRDLAGLIASHDVYGVVVAIGDNHVRRMVSERIRENHPGLKHICAVHPGAVIGRHTIVGEGTVVMAGAVLNPGVTVGAYCIVNTGACLDHDCVMGDYASLAPAVSAGGAAHIGAHSAVGIGAVIMHGRSIGSHTVIGAGATVVDDIGDFCVAYGTPAREVRKREQGDRYL